MIPPPRRPRRTPATRASTATAPAATIAVVFALALSTASPSAPPARAQGPTPQPTHFENVTLLSGGHHVFAQLTGVDESAPTRWVEAALLPRAGACTPPACDPDAPRATARAATIYDGSLEFAFVTAGPFQRGPVRLSPGDRVRLRTIDGGAPADAVLTVGDVTVTAVDAAADRLTGTGPAGARVSVTANRPDGAFSFTSASVGADGTWTADLAGKLDLVPGASGAVTAAVEGVVTQASWSVPRAVVRLGDPVIEVSGQSGDRMAAALRCHSAWAQAAGTAIAWRGGRAPTLLVLRVDDGDGWSKVFPVRAGCRQLTFAPPAPASPQVAQLPTYLSFDLAADVLRSHGPWPSGRYALSAAGFRHTFEVPTGASDWEVSLAGQVDLTSTLPVEVGTDDETAPIAWSVRAMPWAVDEVDPAIVRVRGRGTAGTGVWVDVDADDDVDGSGVVAADGTFEVTVRRSSGAPMPLGARTVLRAGVSQESESLPGGSLAVTTFTAAPLRAAALANRDIVHGTALPGARITVRVGSDRDGRAIDVAAGTDGGWEADFTDIADLAPGMPVAVAATAANGYHSTLRFPVFRASAQVGGDRVIVEGHPGLAAAVEVARGGEVIGGAMCTVGDDAPSCSARVRASDGVTPLVLRPDDEVVVLPNEGATASLRLVPFSAHVDTSARSVVGNCPPNGSMLVRFRAPEGSLAPFDSSTTADGNGVCDYELARGEWELMQPGLTAELIHPLADGHRLFSTGVYEHVRVVNNGPVEGLAEPFSAVTLTLRTARGDDRPLFTVRADGDGRWTTDTPAAAGTIHHPAPGETLLVDDGRRRHVLPHVPLVGWWDDRLGAAVGLTHPDQPVKVVHDLTPQTDGRYAWCHGPSDFSTAVDVADPLGTIAFAAPPADACAVGRAELAAVLPSGDEVRFRLPTEVRPGGRLYLPIGHAARP